MEAPNPFAPPRDDNVVADDSTPAEQIRRALIGHEANLVGVAQLLVLVGVLGAVVFLLIVAEGRPYDGMLEQAILSGLVATVYPLMAVQILRRQAGWRLAAAVSIAPGLFLFPVGTAIAGYAVYLLLSDKGRRVLTPEYAQVVRATPHIKYRTPSYVWVIVAILLAAPLFLVLRVTFG